MKVKFCALGIMAFLAAGVPAEALAQMPSSQQKTFTGAITRLNGSQITFKTASAASYTAETSRAALVRRNGAAMALSEFAVGDKVEVRGLLWPDNSMNAAYVRDLSLYVHNGTFTGKITAIDPPSKAFTMQSRQYGIQNIRTDTLTSFKRNGSYATFADLSIGASATVKGAWDRSYATVDARSVLATVRLVGIEVTGEVMMLGGGGLTVLGDNGVIYGVDVSKATAKSKSNRVMSMGRISGGDRVKITGKHVSEGASITATLVKDLTR